MDDSLGATPWMILWGNPVDDSLGSTPLMMILWGYPGVIHWGLPQGLGWQGS